MKTGLVLFHQGYTDIINCLGLIHYYAEQYTKLIVIIRPEMKDCVGFFCKDNSKITIEVNSDCAKGVFPFDVAQKNIDADFLFHGQWDQCRRDIHKNKFIQNYCPDMHERNNFVDFFYSLYNIPNYVRFLSFIFTRDYALEDSFYKKHNPTNKNYILIHEDKSRNILCKYPKDVSCIQLDKLSTFFFDSLTLLENADGIYCIDSVWSIFIYCIDMKYMYFCKKGIPITIQCNRDYTFMYTPHLPNWTIQCN